MRSARQRGVARGAVHAALAALVLVALAGCSRSPSEKAKKGLESLHSWVVSTRMLGERWTDGSVPGPYVRKALQAFVQKVRQESRQTFSSDLPVDVKGFLVAGLDSTARAADSLNALVKRGDRRAAAGILTQISLRARAADSVKERLGGQ